MTQRDRKTENEESKVFGEGRGYLINMSHGTWKKKCLIIFWMLPHIYIIKMTLKEEHDHAQVQAVIILEQALSMVLRGLSKWFHLIFIL